MTFLIMSCAKLKVHSQQTKLRSLSIRFSALLILRQTNDSATPSPELLDAERSCKCQLFAFQFIFIVK